MRLSRQNQAQGAKRAGTADTGRAGVLEGVVDLVWDRWTILILDQSLRGVTTFETYRSRLLIAPNILSKRLTAMVEVGLFQRRLYTWHPPRFEYVLTAKGEAFGAVIEALITWSNRDDR